MINVCTIQIKSIPLYQTIKDNKLLQKKKLQLNEFAIEITRKCNT